MDYKLTDNNMIVESKDTKSPDMPSNGKVNAISNDKVTVKWNESFDNGNTYYRKVVMDSASSDATLQESNVITTNVLSGLKGYYYVLSSTAVTVDATNGTFIDSESLDIPMTDISKTLYVASVDKAGNVSATYSFKIPTKNISGTVNWVDENNKNSMRPSSVEVVLYRNNVEVAKTTVSATANSNAYAFNGYLTNDENGTAYNYTVKQNPDPANSLNARYRYTTAYSADTFTITNTSSLAISNLNIDPNGGKYNGTTEKTVVQGIIGTTATIADPEKEGHTFKDWTHTGDGTLNDDKYTYGENDGTITANYTINDYKVTCIDVVDSIDGEELSRQEKDFTYAKTATGADFGSDSNDNAYHNAYYYDSCTSVTVGVDTTANVVYRIFKLRTFDIVGSVNWNDKSNTYGSRPDSVTVTLYRNGEEINHTDGLTANDNNEFTYPTMQKYDKETGEAYEYTASQSEALSKNSDDKYTTVQDGFVFTNSLGNNAGFVVSGTITWVDNNDSLGYRPQTVDIVLYRNGEELTTQTVSKDASGYTFTGLDKYDSDLNPYTYTAEEILISTHLVYDNGNYVSKDWYEISVSNLDFTNTLIPSTPIPVKPAYNNTVIVKHNVEEQIYVTLNQMEKVVNDKFEISYTDEYTGIYYNVIAEQLGTLIDHAGSGKYEIVVSDSKYTLNNINIENNQHTSLVLEDGKYYLIIEDVASNTKATLVLDLTDASNDGYKTSYIVNNFWKVLAKLAGEVKMLRMFSMDITVPNVYHINYENSNTVDDTEYYDGEEVIVKDYIPKEDTVSGNSIEPTSETSETSKDVKDETQETKSDTPKDVETVSGNEIKKDETSETSETQESVVKFAGWSLTENGEVDYKVGDTLIIDKDIVLYPIFKSDVKEEKETPDVKETPETSESTEAPKTPEAETPKTSETSEIKDTPKTSETTEEKEAPKTPETPETKETPKTSETPEVKETPKTTETTEVTTTPSVPVATE